MKSVEPEVYLISRPKLDLYELNRYLHEVGVKAAWVHDRLGTPTGETLIEFMARLCYRSFEPGLNPNVTKIRHQREDYFDNILDSRHGSVLAHAHYSFVFHNVSRVFTHEIVRHSAGTDISQESLRYVRLDDIPFWVPDWAQADSHVMSIIHGVVAQCEAAQTALAEHFHIDDPNVPFAEKKAKTSFMRRLAPEGLATSIGMTFNVRALRHVLETRYTEQAEEEMRIVMPQLFSIMKAELPLLFNDYTIYQGSIHTDYRKV